jgi:citrate lyase subunit beta/citryl-CoA lyase
MRSRRSCLSVPGVSAKMLDRARALPADEIVIDLEDSVPPDAKDEARAAVVAALGTGKWEAATVSVRINALDTRWCLRDVIDLLEGGGEHLACLVVPKVERAADVELLARLTDMVAETQVGFELLIETAAGLRNVGELAAASPRVEALIVGYADLAASLGRPPGDDWDWVLNSVLVAARAAGVQAIDGPYFDVKDVPGTRARAARAREIGYDGKWALHPGQLEPLNEVFSPSEEEVARATAVVEKLERAAASDGRGAVMLDGEMIDEAMRKQAVGVLARAQVGES